MSHDPAAPPAVPADLPAHRRRSCAPPATSTAPSRRSCAPTCWPRCAPASDPFPGIVGFDDTVRPELERALLAGHDLVLLGERGQGKTRLIRTLVGLLDEWTPGARRLRDQRAPVRAGHAVGPARSSPSTATTRRSAGCTARERYGEKLATPDTSRRRPDRRRRPDQGGRGPHARRPRDRALRAGARAPTAASSRSTSCPTSPSGSRCRCSTCSRSATSRSAATSCGCRSTCCWSRARTPRTTRTAAASSPRSRTGSAPRSAPTTRCALADEIALVRQEAELVARACRDHLLEVLARFTRLVRESLGRRPALRRLGAVRRRRRRDRRRGGAAPRGASPGRADAVARVCDLPGDRADAARQGRVRGQRGGPRDRGARAPAAARRRRDVPRCASAGADLSGAGRALRGGRDGRDRRPGARPSELLRRVGPVDGLGRDASTRLGDDGRRVAGRRRRPRWSSRSRGCT